MSIPVDVCRPSQLWDVWGRSRRRRGTEVSPSSRTPSPTSSPDVISGRRRFQPPPPHNYFLSGRGKTTTKTIFGETISTTTRLTLHILRSCWLMADRAEVAGLTLPRPPAIATKARTIFGGHFDDRKLLSTKGEEENNPKTNTKGGKVSWSFQRPVHRLNPYSFMIFLTSSDEHNTTVMSISSSAAAVVSSS